jgi:hypothetical protein
LAKGYAPSAAIRKFRCVEISTTETVSECNATNDAVLGICQDEISTQDATDGRIANIQLTGISRCIAGAAINPTTNGGLVTTDSQGRVVQAPVAVGTLYPVVGKALQSASTAGDHIDVLLTPGAVYNTAVS